jgi:hypothetical protein
LLDDESNEERKTEQLGKSEEQKKTAGRKGLPMASFNKL